MLNRRRAFTLVELMIVIAIIGVLLAMLVPFVGGAWSLASSMQCQLNLKHIYEAFVVFDADDMAKDIIGPSAFYPEAEFWPGIPYIACSEASIFSCPSTESSPWEFAPDAPGDTQPGGDPGAWSPPPLPPPSQAPADPQQKDLKEFLNDLRYVHRVRGFEVNFGDPAHQGMGRMNLGTREGQDGRGRYIEIGLDDNSPVTESYMNTDGHDGIIRIYEESDGRVTAKLMKYSCAELNCVLYKNEPLFIGPGDPPGVATPGNNAYGHLGPGASKQGMEMELSGAEDEGGSAGGAGGGASGRKAMRLALGRWAAGLSSNYGITRGAENFQRGVSKPLVMDFTRHIVDPKEPQFTDYLYRSARHSGYINVLFSDGSIESVEPFLLDPLMPGNEALYLP
jgi:prepilin-type N-terminal cleavage/methylation domain-containing protein/prepilin-type processing-associated H-X9-DG protein